MKLVIDIDPCSAEALLDVRTSCDGIRCMFDTPQFQNAR